MASGTIETTHLGVVLITTMLLMLTTTTSFVTSQTQQGKPQQTIHLVTGRKAEGATDV